MPGAEKVIKNLEAEEQRRKAGVFALCQIFAGRAEAQAKTNAPWMDRTGLARKELTGRAVADEDGFAVYLSHTVEYGVYLELANGGKYAILRPTLESMSGEIKQTIKNFWEGKNGI